MISRKSLAENEGKTVFTVISVGQFGHLTRKFIGEGCNISRRDTAIAPVVKMPGMRVRTLCARRAERSRSNCPFRSKGGSPGTALPFPPWPGRAARPLSAPEPIVQQIFGSWAGCFQGRVLKSQMCFLGVCRRAGRAGRAAAGRPDLGLGETGAG